MKRQIANQFRKPDGFWGRIIAMLMRTANRPVYTKLINKLNISDDDQILEIGYGPGDTIKIIGNKNMNCKISGIDFSELMFRQASMRNKDLIKEGRLDLHFGDFLESGFKEKIFSKIYCINVIYFWDDLRIGFKKAFELLNINGVFAIYMASAEDLVKLQFTKTDIFNKYSIDHVKTCLKEAGFNDIEIISSSGKSEHGFYIYALK